MEKKQLYPLKFIAIPSRRPWGGDSLIKTLGKTFVETDGNGVETPLTVADKIGESWELADMGEQDSVVENGWLAGNTISELMETYLERIVGDDCTAWYGRQFPLLIKFLDIREKLSVQVHPDDEIAWQRYDSLGKAEIWYIMDAQPDAKIYMGFNREVSAQELYDRCHNGTVEEVLNVIHPRKGDAILITPGTVHAADGGILVAEIQESSDMTFRLYDWGREFNPATARKMHLEEAMDVINYSPYDPANYIPAHKTESVMETLAERPEFKVSRINLLTRVEVDPKGGFIVYVCPEGEALIKCDGQEWRFGKGDTILIPADMPSFTLEALKEGTVILEGIAGKHEDSDPAYEGDDEEENFS